MLRAPLTHRPLRSKRTLRVEALERRCMLSVAAVPAAPVVTVPLAAAPAALVGTNTPAAAVAPITTCCHTASPPVISNFTIVQNDGVMVLKGKVADKDYAVKGLKVDFGGILAKYHLTATVLADGTFSASMKIPKGGIDGTATAQTHCHGLASNVAMDPILRSA